MPVHTHSRRNFIKSAAAGASAIGIGGNLPQCFVQAAQAPSKAEDKVLVVVQLSGGNDGLNTIVPYADDDYRKARPELALAANAVLKCDDEVGLHPSLAGLHSLLEDGLLTAISAVGYERPNRSHFESMDIWHTCKRKSEVREDGWLGRYLDMYAGRSGGDVPALHLGREQQPFAVTAKQTRVPTVRDVAEFQLRGNQRDALRELLNSGAVMTDTRQPNSLLDFLSSSTTSALAASQRVTDAVREYQSAVSYPESGLGQKMRTIAQLIDAGLTTRVFYVQLDGFDTHAQQAPAHAVLLREWSDAVSAFVRDMNSHGHGQRVCVMTFSEFGRRVQENASQGTDHGAAGPMFLCGGGLQAGIFGAHPSLTDLQDGDLKHAVDFRQVYATVLQSWMHVNPAPILGQEYATLPLFA